VPHRDWQIGVRDILEAAQKILYHTETLDFETFVMDEWMVDAVLRNFTVIGEAANHLPAEVKEAHPEVPWTDMSDLRNIVVHEYFGVDLNIIWHTIREELPGLIPLLEAMLDDNKDSAIGLSADKDV
jgi:uncharacterized protein with HEPN domain